MVILELNYPTVVTALSKQYLLFDHYQNQLNFFQMELVNSFMTSLDFGVIYLLDHLVLNLQTHFISMSSAPLLAQTSLLSFVNKMLLITNRTRHNFQAHEYTLSAKKTLVTCFPKSCISRQVKVWHHNLARA